MNIYTPRGDTLTNTEYSVMPVIAEALRRGVFGQLLTDNSPEDLPLPVQPELDPPEDQTLIQRSLAGTNPAHPRGSVEAKADSRLMTSFQWSLDAANAAHTVRRIVEFDPRHLSPVAEPVTKQELEAHFTPRHIAIAGLISHGISYRDIESILGIHHSTAQTYFSQLKHAWGEADTRDVRPTLYKYFNTGVLGLDAQYLTPRFIGQALTHLIRLNQRYVRAGLLPKGAFQWSAQTRAEYLRARELRRRRRQQLFHPKPQQDPA